MVRIILLLLALLVAGPVLAADTPVAGTTQSGCTYWTICDDMTSTGVCTASDGNNAIVRARNEYTFSAYATDSDETTGPWTVKIYDRFQGTGYDATRRVLLNSVGDVTQANMKFSWNGISGDIHAVVGGTPGTGVTIKIKGCPLTY